MNTVFTLMGLLIAWTVLYTGFRVLRRIWRFGRNMADIAQLPRSGTVRFVIDGDTLQVGDLRVRIAHIDAPEKAQKTRDGAMAAGQAASAALLDMVGGRSVAIRYVDRDAYGRVVARLSLDSADVGLDLVARGLALSDRDAPRAYRAAEKKARKTRRGIWAHDGIIEPAAFRRAHA